MSDAEAGRLVDVLDVYADHPVTGMRKLGELAMVKAGMPASTQSQVEYAAFKDRAEVRQGGEDGLVGVAMHVAACIRQELPGLPVYAA